MRVASMLFALLAVVPVAAITHADPPATCAGARVELRGENSAFTAGRSPSHVFFQVRNVSATPVVVEVEALEWLDATPVERLVVRHVRDASTYRELGSRFSVRAGAELRLQVEFDSPVRGTRYAYRATLRDSGCRLEATSDVTFMHRDPIRRR